MRILIDESLPLDLALEFAGLNVSTVRNERWTGLRNGVLLRTAADAGFDVVLTADGSLPYQQNLRAIGVAVIVITGVRNRIERIRPLIPQIEAALKSSSRVNRSPSLPDAETRSAIESTSFQYEFRGNSSCRCGSSGKPPQSGALRA